MRDAFVESLVAAARSDDRIILITGDLGFGALDAFRAEFPDRFINAGVAEQNLVSLAGSMATFGLKPVVYSIANFPTFRAAEQIRNDVDYPGSDVLIVAVGGGVSYGALGYSHHGLQDYSLFLAFPRFDILAPSCDDETRVVSRWALASSGPKYLRLDKSTTHTAPRAKSLGQVLPSWNAFRNGHESRGGKCILVTGGVLHLALKLQRGLPDHDIYSVPVWGRARVDEFRHNVESFESIITVESHLQGGFGSWVADALRGADWGGEFRDLTFDSSVIGAVGSRGYLEGLATRSWFMQT